MPAGPTRPYVARRDSSTYHEMALTPTCMTDGSGSVYYTFRCGKRILSELLNDFTPRPSAQECTVCKTNRIERERYNVAEAERAIRYPQQFESFYPTVEAAIGAIRDIDVGHGQPVPNKILTADISFQKNETSPNPYRLKMTWLTPEQVTLLAEDEALKQARFAAMIKS